MHNRLRRQAPVARMGDGLRLCAELGSLRLHYLASRNPGASESEVLALWTEETFRGRVDDGLLARACAEIRRRGDQLASAES